MRRARLGGGLSELASPIFEFLTLYDIDEEILVELRMWRVAGIIYDTIIERKISA